MAWVVGVGDMVGMLVGVGGECYDIRLNGFQTQKKPPLSDLISSSIIGTEGMTLKINQLFHPRFELTPLIVFHLTLSETGFVEKVI